MNERALSTGESGTCDYVTLLQSFRRGTLSIHWYSPPWYFQFTFSMSVLLRCPSKVAMFSRFLKVAIATLNFINKVYNCGLVSHTRKISCFTFTLTRCFSIGTNILLHLRLFLNYFVVKFLRLFSNFISSLAISFYHQLLAIFLDWFFWRSFKCVCCKLCSMIIKRLNVFTP